jgi:hypothetical protein
VQSRGIKTVTVAECLGESSTSQWYRSVRQPKSTNTVRNSDFQYY